MKLEAGTVIVCPDCKTPQIKSTKELQPGAQMKDAEWETVGFDMTGIRMGCHQCGTEWFRSHPKTRESQIYTEKHQWVSLTKAPHQTSKSAVILSNKCLH